MLRVSNCCPVDASHTFAVLLLLPVASRFPSGLQATARTLSVWPFNVSDCCPLDASHTLASFPYGAASCFASGLHAKTSEATVQRKQFLSAGNIPYLRRVTKYRGYPLPVRAPRYAIHPASIAQQANQGLS